MRRLRAPYSALGRAIPAGRSLLLGLDYDGTLVPIAKHPSQAVLPASVRRLIKRLSRKKHVWIFIVSGRALPDLKRMVGLCEVSYAGNHGLEIEDGRSRRVHPATKAAPMLLRRLAHRLRSTIRPFSGAWLENKQWTLSIHYRALPKARQRRLSRAIEQALRPYRKRVHVTQGKKVVEVRPPVRWAKGHALAWMKQAKTKKGKPGPFVIYFGDDQTDESAFIAANRMDGLSVFVGNARPTSGRWQLQGPADVRSVLSYLAKR